MRKSACCQTRKPHGDANPDNETRIGKPTLPEKISVIAVLSPTLVNGLGSTHQDIIESRQHYLVDCSRSVRCIRSSTAMQGARMWK